MLPRTPGPFAGERPFSYRAGHNGTACQCFGPVDPNDEVELAHQADEHVTVAAMKRNIEIYGRTIEVLFRRRIREERRFASLDQLKLAMEADIAEAREYFRPRR